MAEKENNNMISITTMLHQTLSFLNNVNATKDCINMPVLHNDTVVGIISNVTDDVISCTIWDKYLAATPEFKKESDEAGYVLCGINLKLATDSINGLIETETFVAMEMYKQFMKDDELEFSKVRKQILKKQKVEYFKQE